jgi:hypothetical protein
VDGARHAARRDPANRSRVQQLAAALDHAKALSRDSGVLAASVVRFTLDELGTRTGVAIFVHGRRQQVRYVSDCRALYANGRKI